MVECPESEDRDIPDDCYYCVLNDGSNCISGKIEVAYINCPYGEHWDETIPGACWDCEYFDEFGCHHPKK